MKQTVRIEIDIHESDSGIFEKILERGYDAIEKALPIGDVLISHNHRKVPIEIKRGSDFTKALYEGRLSQQIVNMYDTHDFPILILESWKPYLTDTDDDHSISEKVRKTLMAMRTLNRKIVLQETKGMTDTLDYIDEIVRDVLNGKLFEMKRPIIIEGELSDSLKILCACRHVSRVTGERLLSEYHSVDGAFKALDRWHELNIGMTLERTERIKRAYSRD